MKRPWTTHRITEQPRIHLGLVLKRLHLGGRDGSAGVVVHDAGDDGLEGGALITAPNEVVAGEFDEELVFAGSYGRRGVGGRVGDGLVGGGG